MRKMLLAAGLFALMIWSAACGNDGLSSQVTITVTPSRPVVISANYTLSGGAVVTQPWFAFEVNVSNNSSETVIIVAIQLTVTGISPNGQLVPVTTAIGTSTLTQTITCNSNPPTSLALVPEPTFVPVAPGTSANLQIGYTPAACPTGSTTTVPTSAVADFFAGNNPDPATKAVINYFYQVTLVPEGYFAADGVTADSRLQLQTTFATQ
jgi:hypothetical protein